MEIRQPYTKLSPGHAMYFLTGKLIFMKDTVLPVVCFNSCTACVNGISNLSAKTKMSIAPNPFHYSTTVKFSNNAKTDVNIYDALGKLVRTYNKLKVVWFY